MPQPPTPAAAPPPAIPQVFEVRQWVRQRLPDGSAPSPSASPPPAALDAARGILLLVGLREQMGLERELGE
eukprot:2362158-Alexandrium_andersonii.AAC.1